MKGWHQMSNEKYHAEEGLSGSAYKHLDNPTLFRWHMDNKEKDEDKFLVGSATHAATLEPDLFSSKYQRTTKRRTEKAVDEAGEAGISLLTTKDYDLIMGMADAAHGNKHARYLIEQEGPVEQSGFWLDSKWGFPVKVRPDKFVPPRKLVVDLKTMSLKGSGRGMDHVFQRAIADLKYHLQAAHNLEMVSILEKEKYEDYCWIVVTNKKPFQCKVFYADAQMILHAQVEIDRLKEIYNDCLNDGLWPDSEATYGNISLPEWYTKEKSDE